MNYGKAVLLVALCSFAASGYAQEGTPAQIEMGASLDTLNNGYADWRSHYIEAEKKLGDRHAVYGSLRETERFKTKDTEVLAGVYYPLAKRWTLWAEGNASPTHSILARWSALGQVQYALDDGWGVHLGLRHTDYSNALINILLVTGERYWSNYRAAYTHSVSTLAGAGSASNGRIQLSRYYGEQSGIGVSLSRGAEIENLGSTLGILSTRVQSIGLNGRHWLDRDWAVSYEIATNKQGSLYTRNAFRLGLRRQF